MFSFPDSSDNIPCLSMIGAQCCSHNVVSAYSSSVFKSYFAINSMDNPHAGGSRLSCGCGIEAQVGYRGTSPCLLCRQRSGKSFFLHDCHCNHINQNARWDELSLCKVRHARHTGQIVVAPGNVFEVCRSCGFGIAVPALVCL